ncbi:MAG: hypothetical protein JRC92_05030 [Deltaproteobacteria bacterium]|nr:hypothetical protein [Deltaproteobacteria bacterium]
MKKLAICAAILVLAASWAGVALAGCAPDLSQEEMDEIKAARLKFDGKIRPLEEQLNRARAELVALLDDPEADFDTLQAAQDKINRLQDERDQSWDRFEENLFTRFPALTEKRACRAPASEKDDGQKGR